jgi:acyl carrier protein
MDGKQALSPTEMIVGEFWMDALQLDKINPDDNFFELGGDSLLTMMMMFRVSDDLNVDMPPDVLMDAPTLREFCKAIDGMRTVQGTADTDDTETGII